MSRRYSKKTSKHIELGVLEYTICTIYIKRYSTILAGSIYKCKISELKDFSRLFENPILLDQIKQFTVFAQLLPFTDPKLLFPKKWEFFINQQEYRESKRKSMASTDAYKCHKCGESRCSISQFQTRSADEPMTTFIRCLNCKHTFKQ